MLAGYDVCAGDYCYSWFRHVMPACSWFPYSSLRPSALHNLPRDLPGQLNFYVDSYLGKWLAMEWFLLSDQMGRKLEGVGTKYKCHVVLTAPELKVELYNWRNFCLGIYEAF